MTIFADNPALALADGWQRDFPLHPQPFATLGASVKLSEGEVIEMMETLNDQGILARIGAAVRPNTAGASTLAAMAVPPARLSEIATLVNNHPSVNHNYEREHNINLWFVVTAANRDGVISTLDAIARQSGIEVIDLPLEQAYHIDLGFKLTGNRQRKAMAHTPDPSVVGDADLELLKALEGGLDLVSQPYAMLATRLGWQESDVLARLKALTDNGVISRFGCILRHRRLGYLANAMAVWDVPDKHVDGVAEKLAQRNEVTLCYRRSRRAPQWRYNLFAMIHGHERETVIKQITEAEQAAGLGNYPSSVLFSRQCFKQRGAQLAPQIKGAA